MTRLIAVLIVIGSVLFSAAPSLAAFSDPPAQLPTVTASGRARVSRAPDYVDVVVGVRADEKTAIAAQDGASGTMAKMVAAINALKLGGQELQTGTVDLGPRYAPHNDGQVGSIIGYSAYMSMRIRTTDLKSVARILDAALGAGANRIEGVSFQIKEAIEAREEAIKLAVRAAKRKAAAMASALDVQLGSVLTVFESSGFGYWNYANTSNLAQVQSSRGVEGGPSDGDAVAPGMIEVWAEATVTFQIDAARK